MLTSLLSLLLLCTLCSAGDADKCNELKQIIDVIQNMLNSAAATDERITKMVLKEFYTNLGTVLNDEDVTIVYKALKPNFFQEDLLDYMKGNNTNEKLNFITIFTLYLPMQNIYLQKCVMEPIITEISNQAKADAKIDNSILAIVIILSLLVALILGIVFIMFRNLNRIMERPGRNLFPVPGNDNI